MKKKEEVEEGTEKISPEETSQVKEETSSSPDQSEEKTEENAEEKKEKTDKKRKEVEAILNIYASFNNTLAHATDMSGKTLSKVTGGMVTKHGRLKANPTIAMFISKRISEELKEKGVTSLYVKIRAKTRNPSPGPGANAIIKSLSREGFKILNILDTTRVPRGGPKVKGGRRGRRP